MCSPAYRPRPRPMFCGTRPGRLLRITSRSHLRDTGFDIFYGAPALIVISSVVDNQWAIENCALAAQNLMLAACAEGLGTCWIGFAQMWLVTPEGKAVLGVPSVYVPVAPIIVGHPKAPPPPVPRKPPEVRWIRA